ncbi:WD40 repeat-like protein [Sistotremastrum suecicum HHB10207 ss-3]|uniref:WD40 repeat-like protein n=1 Tax=Sistotremastrum suecicum HHB10207 ss-3 TaxID=1314776 RepID=A0A165YSK0_9AGAM|nr:WD40 repeat-like protein [Sistotremastrum suecicum HHB10207 ss-3]
MPYTCVRSVRYHNTKILCVSLSPCGQSVAVGGEESLDIWDDFEEDPVVILFPYSVSSIMWIHSEFNTWSLVCGLENGCLVAVDSKSGDISTSEFKSHEFPISVLEKDSVHKLLASGAEGDGSCSQVIAESLQLTVTEGHYKLKARFSRREIDGSSYPVVRALRFCGDGKFLLASFADGSLICFSIQSKGIAWETQLGVKATAASISSSAEHVVVLSSKAVVSHHSLRDMRPGSDASLHRRFTSLPQGTFAYPISFVHDRNLLFSGLPSGNARVWDIKRGTAIDDLNLDAVDFDVATILRGPAFNTGSTDGSPEENKLVEDPGMLVRDTLKAVTLNQIHNFANPLNCLFGGALLALIVAILLVVRGCETACQSPQSAFNSQLSGKGQCLRRCLARGLARRLERFAHGLDLFGEASPEDRRDPNQKHTDFAIVLRKLRRIRAEPPKQPKHPLKQI